MVLADMPLADQNLSTLIEAAARKYKVDPKLVAAVAEVESNGNQDAVSSVGAIGVMQLMPDTAASLGVDPYNKQQNIEGGAKYLRQMLDTFGGDTKKAVAAYNAGPGAVKDYGGVPPYKETQNYVNKVLDIYR
jgi:soluble lytic murein transglycosylase-like protein